MILSSPHQIVLKSPLTVLLSHHAIVDLHINVACMLFCNHHQITLLFPVMAFKCHHPINEKLLSFIVLLNHHTIQLFSLPLPIAQIIKFHCHPPINDVILNKILFDTPHPITQAIEFSNVFVNHAPINQSKAPPLMIFDCHHTIVEKGHSDMLFSPHTIVA